MMFHSNNNHLCLLLAIIYLAQICLHPPHPVMGRAYVSGGSSPEEPDEGEKRGARVNATRQQGDLIMRGGKGDIVQFWELNTTDKASMDSLARNAITRTSESRWAVYRDGSGHYVVPYAISREFERWEVKNIRDAMQSIEANTCIRYVPYEYQEHYLDIQRMQDGCWSFVGRCTRANRYSCHRNGVRGYRSILNLEGDGCATFGIATHELLHSLGLYHEHNRVDRDKYVTVLKDKIKPDGLVQFEKVDYQLTDTYGTSYEYGSVMHYPASAFPIYPGAITIRTKNPAYQYTIGQRERATETDFYKICSIYQCAYCNGRPFNSGVVPAPAGGSPEDGGEEDGGNGSLTKLYCAVCEPASACEPDDEQYFPNYYMHYCCGICGSEWRRRWCAQQGYYTRQRWNC